VENREAIKVLRDLMYTTQDYPLLDGMTMFGDALAMAISALEFRERYDNFWEEVKVAGMKGKETEIHHGGRVFRIREVAQ
jgi:hypothetical protein